MPVQFNKIPYSIREHFGSEETVKEIGSLNERLGMPYSNGIARVLYKLITKEIFPADFIAQIREALSINDEKARSLTREIMEHTIDPIRFTLSEWGIKVSDIDVGNAQPLDAILEKERELLKSVGVDISAPLKTSAEEKRVPVVTTPELPRTVRFAPIQKSPMPFAEQTRKTTSMRVQGVPGTADVSKPLIISDDREKKPPLPTPQPKKKLFFPLNFLKPKRKEFPEEAVKARIETSTTQTPSPPAFGVATPAEQTRKITDMRAEKAPAFGAARPAEIREGDRPQKAPEVIDLETFRLSQKPMSSFSSQTHAEPTPTYAEQLPPTPRPGTGQLITDKPITVPPPFQPPGAQSSKKTLEQFFTKRPPTSRTHAEPTRTYAEQLPPKPQTDQLRTDRPITVPSPPPQTNAEVTRTHAEPFPPAPKPQQFPKLPTEQPKTDQPRTVPPQPPKFPQQSQQRPTPPPIQPKIDGNTIDLRQK